MRTLLLSLMMLMMSPAVLAGDARVYMLRLDDEIGSTTWHNTRQALEEARKENPDLLLVHINTYGGSVVHADSIRTALMRAPWPVAAFVDNNAASAGALIALACDTVVMRTGATMGAATVVNGTDGTAMPDKYQSYMRGIMRSTAEQHGRRPDGEWRRNPAIAEAMVDPKVSIKGLIDSTRVLTLTTDEAIRWGYADDKAESISQMLGQLGIKDYTITEYNPTWSDRLIGFLTNPAVQAVLIMVIVGGIYMELHTQGMGFPSAAAITAAVLYFLPIYMTGIASTWIILVFAAGLILLCLEIFVVPGFGVTGISGIVCVSGAIILGLIENASYTVTSADTSTVWSSIGIFVAGVLLAIILIWYLTSKHGPAWVRKHTDLTTELRSADGFIGVDIQPASLLGHHGTAVTDMRPAGKVEVDGKRHDAVSTGCFIYAGTRVRIVRYENAQIYVEPEN